MVEKPTFIAHKSQEEIAEYLRNQRLFGPRNFPHFEDAAQRIENYGEINQRHSPENREALVFMLSMVAQVAASGLLEQMYKEPKMMANGTSREGIGADVWLEYWTTPTATYASMAERLKQLINPVSRLAHLSEHRIKKEVSHYIVRGDVFLHSNAQVPLNYSHMEGLAIRAKSIESSMRKK